MSAAGASAATPRVVYCSSRGECEAAYKQVIFVPSSPAPKNMHVWVSATTGRVLWASDRLQTQSGAGWTPAVGTGRGLYVGRTTPVQLQTAAMPGPRGNRSRSFTLHNLQWNLRTMDIGGRKDVFADRAKPYTGRTNAWGDGTSRSRATVAVDAHYGLTTTLDYYKAVHGQNSWDGRGGNITAYMYVQYNNSNAFYNNRAIFFAMGTLPSRRWLTTCSKAGDSAPMVTLDFTAHELTHGVTAYSSDLIYSRSSGALNEAMSDIMAQCVVQWSYEQGRSADPANFIMGAGMYKPANCTPGATRWMFDPPRDSNKSFGCWDPTIDKTEKVNNATWSRDYMCEVDVHWSSGIANRAFYLATAGLNSTSNNGSLPAAIGLDKACKVFYRANAVYLAPSSDYYEMRIATARAALDLFGPSAPEAAALQAAWDIVGAPTAPFPNPAAPECDASFGTDPAA